MRTTTLIVLLIGFAGPAVADQRCEWVYGRYVCVDMNNGVPDAGGQRCNYAPDGRRICVDTRR